MKKLYLYIARRDKKEVKILSVFPFSRDFPATRVPDVKTLGLPDTIAKDVYKKIHDNRMLWEPWIESADAYPELEKSLKGRGYSNVPAYCSPSFSFPHLPVAKKPQPKAAVITTSITKGVKSMLRRGRGV